MKFYLVIFFEIYFVGGIVLGIGNIEIFVSLFGGKLVVIKIRFGEIKG